MQEDAKELPRAPAARSLGTCFFDSSSHEKNPACIRWAETRECEGCGLYKPIEEMSGGVRPGPGESYQCEACRGY